MKWLKRISSFLLMGFSILIFASSLTHGVGSLQSPGPGFMGFFASILLFLLTFIILIKESTKSAEDKEKGPLLSWGNLTKPFVLTVALCGYTLVLETLGYLVPTFFLMFIMLFIANPRKWYLHMINAFIIVNITYLIFYKMLRVLLPVGTYRIFW